MRRMPDLDERAAAQHRRHHETRDRGYQPRGNLIGRPLDTSVLRQKDPADPRSECERNRYDNSDGGNKDV